MRSFVLVLAALAFLAASRARYLGPDFLDGFSFDCDAPAPPPEPEKRDPAAVRRERQALEAARRRAREAARRARKLAAEKRRRAARKAREEAERLRKEAERKRKALARARRKAELERKKRELARKVAEAKRRAREAERRRKAALTAANKAADERERRRAARLTARARRAAAQAKKEIARAKALKAAASRIRCRSVAYGPMLYDCNVLRNFRDRQKCAHTRPRWQLGIPLCGKRGVTTPNCKGPPGSSPISGERIYSAGCRCKPLGRRRRTVCGPTGRIPLYNCFLRGRDFRDPSVCKHSRAAFHPGVPRCGQGTATYSHCLSPDGVTPISSEKRYAGICRCRSKRASVPINKPVPLYNCLMSPRDFRKRCVHGRWRVDGTPRCGINSVPYSRCYGGPGTSPISSERRYTAVCTCRRR